MTPQQIAIAGMMITIVILFLLVHLSWRQRARLSDLLELARDEARDVYSANDSLKRELKMERDIGDRLRRENRDLTVENTRLVDQVARKQQRMEALERKLAPEDDPRKPVPARPAAPAPAGYRYDAKSDSYQPGRVDDGAGLLQTAILVSAFDNSPAREKEITDAQNSSHRSAGHEPVCSPSYESRHSGGAGESHSSHSSSDSGSSSSSDSGSSGSCD